MKKFLNRHSHVKSCGFILLIAIDRQPFSVFCSDWHFTLSDSILKTNGLASELSLFWLRRYLPPWCLRHGIFLPTAGFWIQTNFHAGFKQYPCHVTVHCTAAGTVECIQTFHRAQFLLLCQPSDGKSVQKKSVVYCMGYFYPVYPLRCDRFFLLFCQPHVLHADGT